MRFCVVSAAFSVLLMNKQRGPTKCQCSAFCREPCLYGFNETQKLCSEQNSAITMHPASNKSDQYQRNLQGNMRICRGPNHTYKKNSTRLISEVLCWHVCHCVLRCFCVSFPVVRKIQLDIVLHKFFGESNFRMSCFTCKGIFLPKLFAKYHKVLQEKG